MPAANLTQRRPRANARRTHQHRTAKVIELVATSTQGFEDAIRNGLADAREAVRGITGAHVQNLSVRCDDGNILEYKVDLKVAFGIERTGPASSGSQADFV